MTDLRTAAQQALEALKSTGLFLHHCWCDVQMNDHSFEWLNRQMEIVDAAIIALRAALAQEQAELTDEYRKGFIDGQIDMRAALT